MVFIEAYTAALLERLQTVFAGRLVYLGLQGSYLRGEQQESSDIDIMAVIDRMSVSDMDLYRDALLKVGDYEKSCGFICGKEELSRWNPLEICHLLHTTRDLYGVLSELVPAYTREDEKNFIRLSVGNLYHEICHRYIHGERAKNIARLPACFKSVFFILQNLLYLKKGVFYPTRAELRCRLQGQDKAIFELAEKLENAPETYFDSALSLLFDWCRDVLARLDAQAI
ncbi:MAG: hypothetical protein HFG27_09595 [Provencibacterium sp.]|jgi:predicted nucleotidyltransferase|nr:hypothetical protein [Provencibacterium sp.]